MEKEGICSLEWILYIDWKAFFSNRGHYQKDKQQHVQSNTFEYISFITTITVNFILILVLVTIMLLLFYHFSSCPGAADSASSSSSSSSSFVNGATSKNLPAVQTVAPMPEDTMENMRSELSPSYSLWPFHFTGSVPSYFLLSPCLWLLFFMLNCLFSCLIPVPSSSLKISHFTYTFITGL